MAESNRQKKIAAVLQKDLASELQNEFRKSGQSGIIVSVSKVSVTVDLSLAKVYTSIFPADKADIIVKELNVIKPKIKHRIAQLTKNQLRRMPDLQFYNDDSLEYINRIEKAVKGTDDPIKDPNLLDKRKKK
ncbi:MAG: 30S ribosome-binding factor RbfA [Bacteroidia bacterium]|nr:30S ribosome-binding factor RbfA [Bacteroidia bacterium]NNM24049.1 30S ribosome-binding factor RbfA [Flavobacteriaceae bacterium]